MEGRERAEEGGESIEEERRQRWEMKWGEERKKTGGKNGRDKRGEEGDRGCLKIRYEGTEERQRGKEKRSSMNC